MGFSNKSYLLQIIPGSLLLAALIPAAIVNWEATIDYREVFDALDGIGPVVLLPLLFIAFILGAILDLLADCIELMLYRVPYIKQPSRCLLYRGEVFGIKLPHYQTIQGNLSEIVRKHTDCAGETVEYFNKEAGKHNCIYTDMENKKKYCKKRMYCKKWYIWNIGNAKANHLFQAARSIAFRKCGKYQIDQIEAYFSHYISSRNTSLCLFIIFILNLFNIFSVQSGMAEIALYISISGITESGITITLFAFAGIFWLAYYRFKVYYSRSVLETIYIIK